MKNEWIKGISTELLDKIYFECEYMFGDNHSEITEYYIETICGEGLDEYVDDVERYETKEIEAFKWGADWLIEYITSNNRLPEQIGRRHSSDENMIGWLIEGYDEADEVKSMVIQMNRDRMLDELLS